MKPYYDSGGITLFHADCREVLPGLSGDVVVADPPYNAGKDCQGCRAIGIEIEERYCELAVRRLSQEVFAFGEESP
jgi:DNA modification methylase